MQQGEPQLRPIENIAANLVAVCCLLALIAIVTALCIAAAFAH